MGASHWGIILHKRKKMLVVPKIDCMTYLTNRWPALYSDCANICGGEGQENTDVGKGDPTTTALPKEV